MSDPKTSIASYVSSGALVLFGMTLDELSLLIGIFLAFATFFLNWHYKHKHLKLIERKVQGMPFPSLNGEDDV